MYSKNQQFEETILASRQ